MSATPEQWAEAREAYEAGESARSIGRRLGVDHSAVTRRAKRDGWVVQAGAPGGAVGQRRVPARPGAPAEGPAEVQQPTPTDDPGRLIAGDQRPKFDPSTPEGQRAILQAAGILPKPWPEVEARLEELAEDQRAEREEARPWLRRPRW